MGRYKVTTTKYIEITPDSLAEIFWEMDDEEQSYFFNHLLEIATEKDLERQLYMTYNSKYLSTNGKTAFDILKNV